MPPDQLLFSILNNICNSDNFWKNPYSITRPIFILKKDYIDFLNLKNEKNLANSILELRKSDRNKKGMVRDAFKKFYLDEDIQKLVKGKVKYNPFRVWRNNNEEMVEEFQKTFIEALESVYKNEFNISSEKLNDCLY